MLDHFLKVAYKRAQTDAHDHETFSLLKQLPAEDLYKLASGEITKEAYLDDCSVAGGVTGPKAWIDKFKGTPLFDQAVALEQEEIQLEMDELQKRQERRAQRQQEALQEDSMDMWSLRDQLRLKKRLLELQAAQAEVTGQPPPMVAPEAPPAAESTPPAGPPAAEKSVQKEAAASIQFAENLGRSLARSDFEKSASLRTGDSAGRLMAQSFSKVALDMGAMGQAATKMLSSNKGALIGAGIGAAGGLASGLQKDQNGQRHLMSGLAQGAAGAVAGGAVGHAAQGIGGRMMGGQGFGAAAKAYGGQVKQEAKAIMGAGKGGGGAPSAAPAGQLGAGPASSAKQYPTSMFQGTTAPPAAQVQGPRPSPALSASRGPTMAAPMGGTLQSAGAATPAGTPGQKRIFLPSVGQYVNSTI